jgi:hypothetical protein
MTKNRIERVAGLCGLVGFATFTLGWIIGDLSQRPAFSPAHHDISYLGALTAKSPWLYDRLAANVTGALVVVLAVGLWLALSPSLLGRLGAATLAATGVGMFLDGIFRLDCQPIDAGCINDSWHSHAHKIESDFTIGFTFASIVLLALAFRRIPGWRSAWLPAIAAIPAVFVANLALSSVGPGAATRAGTVVVSATFAYFGLQLLEHAGWNLSLYSSQGRTLTETSARSAPRVDSGRVRSS